MEALTCVFPAMAAALCGWLDRLKPSRISTALAVPVTNATTRRRPPQAQSESFVANVLRNIEGQFNSLARGAGP